MNIDEQKIKATEFKNYWKNKGYEKGQSQPFWISLLSSVLGVSEPEKFITFEDQVKLDNTSFIDGFIQKTHVLIEQKGIGKDLRKPIKQSDGTLLNPFQQAKRYAAELPYSQRPRWIVTCNFSNFLVYNMETPNGEPEEILLENLDKEYYRLQFLVDEGNEHLKKEMEVSIQAGELVGKLYDEILKLYNDNTNKNSLKSLNMLCVRLVFCLYAEDAGIFGKRGMFHDYLANIPTDNIRKPLIELFKLLDTKIEDRDTYLEPELAQFPYVNGGLFANENIEIPNLTLEVKNLILSQASDNFDWSEISPTIFGAVFESTLNPETRRSGGMHYTSIENIHKVIDPLFLDTLRDELSEIKKISVLKTRNKKLEDFQNKLSNLKFLDPACGSGNFLTETYISLRKLENETIKALNGIQIFFGSNPIQVSINQFYGIEINDFAVTVGKTALWIAESQMLKETEDIMHCSLDFLPLKSYTNITEGNALRIKWEDVVDKNELNYIIGNPPFIGARLMTKNQKEDIISVFNGNKNAGNVDYVSGWFTKAANYIENTNIEVSFVSTNSITQGEQVPIIWKPILEKGIHINFAYRTFRWDSEANNKAAVHCVVIGFSYINRIEKIIFYTNHLIKKIDNINAYLIHAPNIFITSRKSPLCPVTKIDFGSMPNDNGYLSDFNEESKNQIIKDYPEAKDLFFKFIGAKEFLHNKTRYCLWLKNISPEKIKSIRPIFEIVQQVRQIRLNSSREATKKLADYPTLFGEIRQPESDYLVIPRHSSENRKYIPVGYMSQDIICGDANLLIPNTNLHEFAILTSNVHNSWVRAIAGRIKSDYRYSASIIYNTFPWCSLTDAQKVKLENTANAILNARKLYPTSSLSVLYDEVLMPSELRKAHQENDMAVMEAYGFPIKDFTETMCVAELMKMYAKLTD